MKRGVALAALLAAGTMALPAPAAAKPRTPVVMVLLDELPTHSLLARNGRIDRIRYPSFAALARTSTWYSNATTASDASKTAIPAILDGRTPRRNEPATYRAHPQNLFTLLKRQGYRLDVHEESTDLCPYRGCRRTQTAREFLANDRIKRFRDFVASLKPSRRPTLFYEHALLPHVPWIFMPSTRRFDRTVLGPISGLNSSDRSVFDPTLVGQSWQRHLLQVGAADTLLGEMVAQMKRTGLWNRALVVVMSDHGVSFRVGATDRRTIVPANAKDIAAVPVFIKFPRQRRGRIDRSLLRTYDVLPTIARRIGLRLPRGLSGRPAGSAAVRRRGRISVLSRSSIRRVTYSRAGLLRARRAALGRKLELFGQGPRSLLDFGPNRRILLDVVNRYPVAGPAGGLRAELTDPSEYENVNPGASFAPTHVTGRILGGRRGQRRDLAVAINGYLRGVTRSARIRGQDDEYFSFLVAESALSPGPNPVEIFTVTRRRGKILLRRIFGRPYPGRS